MPAQASECDIQSSARVAAYLAEHLAGNQIDDLRPHKEEKGGNVKYCGRFSAGHQRKRKKENIRHGFRSCKILKTM